MLHDFYKHRSLNFKLMKVFWSFVSYKTFIMNYTLYKGYTVLGLRYCNTATLTNGMLNTCAL